jgi:eukaryotic-like serine/threonine-protein kinase
MKTLSELMDQALDLDADMRSRWVADLSRGPHAALQPFLADMLAKQTNMQTAFMVKPITLPDAPLASNSAGAAMNTLASGTRIGPYVLQREVGQGGMGAVWLANRVDGAMTRQVALKLPTIHLTQALAERFSRERDILAQLTHPNIARLYDAGVSDTGRPYLALEYVEGKPITEHCDAINLPVNERLQRFLQVASAVQYAHANLVIHRDLKPSNILVSEDGQVHLLDFGIAKLLDDPKGQANETELTMLAGRALTLDYASPEQVNGLAISTASDVYSMGVVLYQLLTGLKPYQLKRGSRAELEEAILVSDAERMSDAVQRGDAAIAAMRGAGKDRLARMLKGDLDTIVAKAMKKDPAHRYATVASLAADIQRHLDGQPVEAQPDSWRYRAGKFVARNRVGVAAATAVVASLALGLGIALWQTGIAQDEARRADALAQQARDEKLRADQQAQQVLLQGSRADREATLAQDAAVRADAQAKAAVNEAKRADSEAAVARNEALRADREALSAKREATRADQEARLARAETTRGNAVQNYLVDLFSANSNDQKNAIQVRNLNAKQLLDRGAEKLEAAGGVYGDVDAALFRLFGTLYENLGDYETSKRLNQRSVVAADAAHGKESTQYVQAILELAWVESYGQLGKRLDLIEQAEKILRRVAPTSDLMIQALNYEAISVSQSDPARAAKAATESIKLLQSHESAFKMKAMAQSALGHAERGLGNLDAALAAYQRAAEHFIRFTGPDNPQVADAMAGVTVCLRQLLRLTEAEAAARKTVEIMRPFDRELADAKVIGRLLAVLIAERGRSAEAQTMLESSYARLPDVDGKPHALKSGISLALGDMALARGDAQTAIVLAQRSLRELTSKTPSIVAAGHILIAKAGIDAGELRIASDAVREAKKVQAERGLPILGARAIARVSAEVAALEGDEARARAEFSSVSNRVAAEDTAPLSRLMSDVSKSRVLALLGHSDEVSLMLAPWLRSSPLMEIPVPIHAEVLLLAGEAALKTGAPEASKLLRQASEMLRANELPDSPRLARAKRALSASEARVSAAPTGLSSSANSDLPNGVNQLANRMYGAQFASQQNGHIQ